VDVHVHRRFSVRVSYDFIGSFADIVEVNARFGLGLVTRFNRESSQRIPPVR
jgi:hypothetical protein